MTLTSAHTTTQPSTPESLLNTLRWLHRQHALATNRLMRERIERLALNINGRYTPSSRRDYLELPDLQPNCYLLLPTPQQPAELRTSNGTTIQTPASTEASVRWYLHTLKQHQRIPSNGAP